MVRDIQVRCGSRHRLYRECLELAKVFRCGRILDQKGPKGQLARVAPDEGIPTIDPELGGSVGWDERSIQKGLNGVFNILYHYNFLDGEIEQRPQTRATGFEHYRSPNGGLVNYEVDLGSRVTRGDALFQITDPFGTAKTTVKAKSNGVFWRHRRLPQVASGEYICSVRIDIDEF